MLCCLEIENESGAAIYLPKFAQNDVFKTQQDLSNQHTSQLYRAFEQSYCWKLRSNWNATCIVYLSYSPSRNVNFFGRTNNWGIIAVTAWRFVLEVPACFESPRVNKINIHANVYYRICCSIAIPHTMQLWYVCVRLNTSTRTQLPRQHAHFKLTGALIRWMLLCIINNVIWNLWLSLCSCVFFSSRLTSSYSSELLKSWCLNSELIRWDTQTTSSGGRTVILLFYTYNHVLHFYNLFFGKLLLLIISVIILFICLHPLVQIG